MQSSALGNYARLMSRICPLPPTQSMENRLGRLLRGAAIFMDRRSYAKFALSSLIYPASLEVVVFLLLPNVQCLPFIGLLAAVQAFPVLLLFIRRRQRKRGVEDELPFVAMLLFVLSHEAFPNLREAFARVRSAGAELFPFISREAALLERDLTYGNTSELSIIESAFLHHPSSRFQSFVHGYVTTLLNGKDIRDFAVHEASRLIELLEEKWHGFVHSVASLTEISFTLLAIFPVGIQMVATTFLNLPSLNLVILSLPLLAGATATLLVVMDSTQPAIHDERYPAAEVGGVILVWTVSSLLFCLGYFGASQSLLPPLAASVLVTLAGRRHFRNLHAGEREIGVVLHDLAEESRAGASLPAAVSRVASYSERFPSMQDSILLFGGALELGAEPTDAQRLVRHPSWLVRVSMAVLAASFETGAGFEQLDKLSLSFRRIADARESLTGSILPFVMLGLFVPVISCSALWFLGGIGTLGSAVPGLTFKVQKVAVAVSISLTSLLSGLLVSKAYTLSVRNLVALPPILAANLISFLVFGLF